MSGRVPGSAITWSALSLLVGFGCAPDPVHIVLPDDDGSLLGFLVVLDDGSQPQGVIGPLVREGASLEVPDFFSAPSDSRVLLVRFSDRDLRSVHPFVDLRALREARLSFVERRAFCVVEDPSEDMARGSPATGSPIFSFGDDGQAVELSASESAALREVFELELRTSPAGCPLVDIEVQSFGPEPHLVTLEDLEGAGLRVLPEDLDLEWVSYLDEDRIVAAARRFLFYFERGRPFHAVPGEMLFVGDLPVPADGDPAAWIRDFALVPGDGAPARLLLAYQGSGRPRGGIVEVEIASGIGAVRTATTSGREGLHSLSIGKDGLIAAVGNGGVILTATSAEGPYRRTSIGPMSLEQVEDTGDPGLRHVVGANDGRLWAGHLGRLNQRGEPDLIPYGIVLGNAVRAISSLPMEDAETEIWIASQRGTIARVESDGLHPHELPPPWPFREECEVREEGSCSTVLVRDPQSIALLANQSQGASVLLLGRGCSQMLLFHPRAGCAQAVPHGLSLGEADGLFEAEEGPGGAIAVGWPGLVLELGISGKP